MSDIPGADARRREQERIRKEYPDLYYYAVGVALVVALMIAGYALFPDRDGYLTNLFTEAASVAVTLLVLNRMAEARERRRYRQDLIYRMGSQVNAEAIHAADELWRNRWLQSDLLKGVNLIRANLEGAPLWQANLAEADLLAAILIDAQLIGSNLTRATLWGADLRRAQLSGAHLIEVNRRSISMKGRSDKDKWIYLGAPWKAFVPLPDMNFEGAFLMNANLEGADLSDAIFRRANLLGASLIGADLEGADFEDSILEGATLPNGERWHPGYDMSIFTNPPDGRKKEQPITDHQTEDASRPPTSPLPPGTPGEVLLQRIHEFDFTPEDLEEMSRAIEEDCERIDPESFSDSAT